MKIHEMKLLKAPYLEIKAGRKNVEMRLYDEKRQGIAAGDEILFTCPELAAGKVRAKVRGVYIYEDFFALVKSYSSRELGFDGACPEYIGEFMLRLYGEEAVNEYGVCAILLDTEK